ncbi:MAG: hypothetical protein M1821_008055 [Bathelium mastoideum]|nr:MAG: hypothetical protein M1821_008055 [Bathelium mastoideum]
MEERAKSGWALDTGCGRLPTGSKAYPLETTALVGLRGVPPPAETGMPRRRGGLGMPARRRSDGDDRIHGTTRTTHAARLQLSGHVGAAGSTDLAGLVQRSSAPNADAVRNRYMKTGRLEGS